MLVTIEFVTPTIFEYTSKKILGNNKGRLGSGDDAIPAETTVPVREFRYLSSASQLGKFPAQTLASSLKVSIRLAAITSPIGTIRLYQACRDCGR